MPQHFIRLAYVVEFLLSFMVVLFAWGEIGGQGHLDFIPWHWKLGLGAGLSLAIVRATASLVESEAAWNPRFFRWLLAVLVLVAAIGFLTYHYHLLEPPEEDEDSVEQSTAASLRPARGRPVQWPAT